MKRIALLLTEEEFNFLSNLIAMVGTEFPIIASDKSYDGVKLAVDTILINTALWGKKDVVKDK